MEKMDWNLRFRLYPLALWFKLRALLRDWFCMQVLAYWLRHASAEQLYELGTEFVRTAVERENPDENFEGVHASVVIQRDLPEVEQAQKWLA